MNAAGGSEPQRDDAAASGPPLAGEVAGEKITSLRDQINTIDNQVLELLARRRQLSSDVARNKADDGAPVRDPGREEAILARLIRQGRKNGLDAHFVTCIFHEIIGDSVRLQQEYLQRLANREDAPPEVIRIAFQGIEGAYSHLAAKSYFSKDADRLVFSGYNTFGEAIRAVEDGQADYAMLPVENTTSGSINEVYDLLLHTRLSIVGEEKYRVRHCLVGARDVPLSHLRTIYSHPQAVAQCTHFLAELRECKVEYFTDTAMSVSKIKEEGDATQAAIASEEAAVIYGLHVLKKDIANQRDNYTRFLIAARNAREVDLRIPCKTSVVMATGQAPGSLAEAILVFRAHGVNLTKVESRPILGNPWEEMFYLDFEGNLAQPNVSRMLDALRRKTRFLKVLGCYPSRDLPPTPPPTDAITGSARDRALRIAPDAVSVDEPAPPTPARVDTTAFRLASRTHKSEDTVVDVKGVKVGGGPFVIIAGPPVVESLEQISSCARQVKENGGSILSGGCFTSPHSAYGFQGLGLQGLAYLAEAGGAYQLPTVTEVLTPADVASVASRADLLLVGGRNMQNSSLLQEVGRLHRPVLLQRGHMASIEELLEAAEHILAQGNLQVILCEAGIRTFETAFGHTLDLPAIPRLKRLTHLPVIVDPSRASAQRELLSPLAEAARAVGADGVMVEIHPRPEESVASGSLSLYYSQFEELAQRLLS